MSGASHDWIPVIPGDGSRHLAGAAGYLERRFREDIVPNQMLLDLLPRVRVERIVLASNQESRSGEYVEARYAREGWLSGAYLSHRLGARKPDPTYFRRLLDSVGSTAADCLFVDDNADNVTAAHDIGIPGVRFTTTPHLVDELRRRGLLDRAVLP